MRHGAGTSGTGGAGEAGETGGRGGRMGRERQGGKTELTEQMFIAKVGRDERDKKIGLASLRPSRQSLINRRA